MLALSPVSVEEGMPAVLWYDVDNASRGLLKYCIKSPIGTNVFRCGIHLEGPRIIHVL